MHSYFLIFVKMKRFFTNVNMKKGHSLKYAQTVSETLMYLPRNSVHN